MEPLREVLLRHRLGLPQIADLLEALVLVTEGKALEVSPGLFREAELLEVDV